MICSPCKKKCHDKCTGGKWCSCQHQPPGTGMPVPYDELVVKKMTTTIDGFPVEPGERLVIIEGDDPNGIYRMDPEAP